MPEELFSRIYPDDRRATAELNALLEQEGISLDRNLDYTAGLYDEEGRLIATGSYYKNTLRCLAVDSSHQGEGLLPLVVSHLADLLAAQGVYHLFLYAKFSSARFFRSLGFHEICTVNDTLVFMENRAGGFESYLLRLEKESVPAQNSAAIVMNANPFTLGHQYLVEQAAAACERLHLFVVSEEMSLIPAEDRFALVQAGTAHLSNVTLHQTDSYLISSATFPSYFLKEDSKVILAQARLDTEIFKLIAKRLGIATRYVGEEPFSVVTGLYNQVLQEELTAATITFHILPRREADGEAISASRVRRLIAEGKLEEIRSLVPDSTYDYFLTPRGQATAEKICNSGNVVHY